MSCLTAPVGNFLTVNTIVLNSPRVDACGSIFSYDGGLVRILTSTDICGSQIFCSQSSMGKSGKSDKQTLLAAKLACPLKRVLSEWGRRGRVEEGVDKIIKQPEQVAGKQFENWLWLASSENTVGLSPYQIGWGLKTSTISLYFSLNRVGILGTRDFGNVAIVSFSPIIWTAVTHINGLLHSHYCYIIRLSQHLG